LRVDELVQAMGVTGIRPSTVPKLCKDSTIARIARLVAPCCSRQNDERQLRPR
jgi:hypothetical protein